MPDISKTVESLPRGRLSHLTPAQMVGVQAALQVCLWSLVPALLYASPPLDVVESYVHGPQWVLTTLKHPALPSWVLEITRLATGTIGWPAYVVSQLFVAATLLAVFLLGRDLLGPARAAIGTLALTGVVYFSWVSIEFNHNVALMPLWAGFFLGLWRAVETGRMIWWLATGVLAAAMMYTKLSAGVGVLIGVLWLLGDARARASLWRPSPWCAAMISAALVVPLYMSLNASGFAPLAYAAARAASAPSGVAAFIGAQVLALIGMAALLALAYRAAPHATASATDPALPRARAYLMLITLAPVLIVIAGAVMSGTGLRSAWGASMLSFAGLLAVAYLPALGPQHVRPLFNASCTLGIAAPLIFGALHLWQQANETRPPRGSWPRAEMAAAVGRIWQDETGRPLRYVAGHFWPAGLVALSSRERTLPTVIVDGDLASTPGTTLVDLKRHGVLILNTPNHAVTPDTLAGLAPPRKIGTVTIPFRHGRRGQVVTLRYAIIAPE